MYRKLKYLLIGLVLYVLLAQGTASPVLAAGGPLYDGNYSSALFIQNTAGVPANCTIRFYNSVGSLVQSYGTNVPVGQRYVFHLATHFDLPAGVYGTYTTCDQNIIVSAKTVRVPVVGRMGAETQTSRAYGPYIATLFANYASINSNIVVMGMQWDQTVYIDYYTPGGILARTDAMFLPALGTVVFEPTGLASGYYSAILRSSLVQPLFTAIHNWSRWGQTWGSAPATGATSVSYLPQIFYQFFGYDSSISIFNPTSSSANYTVTYTNGWVDSGTIPGYGTAAFSPNLPVGSSVGATVTSNGNVAVVVNEVGSFHVDSFPSVLSASSTVYVPHFMRAYASYGGYLSCQNLGGTTGVITVSYEGGYSEAQSIGSGQVGGFNGGGAGLPNDWRGSVVVSITGGNYVGCVVTADRSSVPFDNVNKDGRSLYVSMDVWGNAYYIPGVAQAYWDPRRGVVDLSTCAHVIAARASWTNNYGPAAPGCAGVENVPMIGSASDIGKPLSGNNSSWLLGFNEPDMPGWAQQTPSQGADNWYTVRNTYPTMTLALPVPVSGSPFDPLNWLHQFRDIYISRYGALPGNALTGHFYFVSTADAAANVKEAITLAQTWGIAEVWITEMGTPFAPCGSVKWNSQAEGFIDWLNTQAIITRYEWFGTYINPPQPWYPSSWCDLSLVTSTGDLTAFGVSYTSLVR